MRSTGGKVEVGAVIGDMVDVYRANFGVLVGAAAAVFAVVGVLQALLYNDGNVIAVAIGSVLGLIGLTLYSGFVVKLVEDVRSGRRDFTVGELFSSAAGAVGALLVNAIVKAVLVVIGFVLLVLPGIYLLTIWAVTAPVIVIERAGGIEAFNRSGDLVRGQGWGVLAVVAVTFAIGLIVAALFSAAGAPFDAGGQVLMGTIGSIVAAPITALVASILYFQLADG